MKANATHPQPIGSPPAPERLVEDERARVRSTYPFETLQNDPELSAIAVFAARLCETASAMITVMDGDRQRFLVRHGVEGRETPPVLSLCAQTMLQGGILQVPDADQDPRFLSSPLVTEKRGFRFYAGQALISADGTPLGALCVIGADSRVEGLSELQREGLQVLGQAVMRRLDAGRDIPSSSSAAMFGPKARLEHLPGLMDAIPALAWTTDEAGNFNCLNRRMREFTGLEDCSAGPPPVHPDDLAALKEAWANALRTGEVFEIEHRLPRHDGEYRWMISRAEPIRDEEGRVLGWFGTTLEVHDLHALAESRDLLAKELSHRIKNIFAVVSGLVSLSTRKRPDVEEFGKELIGTIRALGRAHDYVRPAGGERRSSLHGILADLFSPYGEGEATRVRVAGDDCPITARAATPLALVFHELATNSAKYGALSGEHGSIEVEIEDRGDKLGLRWREMGGPPVEGEPVDGFGSRLVEMSVSGQLGGIWHRHFRQEGLLVELEVSKAAISP